jgi:primosomal replication protein N
MLCNELKLSGQIVKLYPVKITPAGIAIQSFVLEHISGQLEAGSSINIRCRVFCVWVNPIPEHQSQCVIGECAVVTGFISHNAKLQMVLHIKNIVFLDKGN